jgi:D-beta-D-heptose 7-phosphate kinase/D-beta-D-heptose 1-phosphate adenosyltransferase
MGFQNIDFSKAKVLIIGDIMLDQYWHGGTSRISPEAPVPVVHINRVDERPGGAANVALGIKALGANPHLLGYTGYDLASETLERLLKAEGVYYEFSRLNNLGTITKLRVMSRNQQMIRLDREKLFSNINDASLFENYTKALNDNVDTVILSDYGKGTLENTLEFIKKAREKNIPVIVDPKSTDFSIYRGASIITPNLKEFEAVVGPSETIDGMIEKALQLMQRYEIEALVITRSEKGLSVITRSGSVTHVPALAREVHDVTGAGDTVIAVLASALASGIDLIKAATLSNIAAGVAVSKLGAVSVSLHEIQAASCLEDEGSLPTGVMTEEALLNAVRLSKAKGERIVFTNGCFDILHSGHVLYLEQARLLGDRVIVAVNDNASVARLKGPERPINALEDRMAVLAGLRSVDWVIPFSEDTPERIIQAISPHILVKGGDYQDVEALPGAHYVLSRGGQVRLLGLKEGCSTTRVIEQIALKSEDKLLTSA